MFRDGTCWRPCCSAGGWLLEEPPLTTLASLQGSLLRNDVLAALDVLRCVPVLVLTGAEDRLTRPQHSVLMASAIGDAARLVLVPGAGHIVNQTRPVEVNAALVELLDRVGRHSAAKAASMKNCDLAESLERS